jgi:hypothetical protein
MLASTKTIEHEVVVGDYVRGGQPLGVSRKVGVNRKWNVITLKAGKK